MYYAITNEFCANKPHRLRRSETNGGNGGQTFYEINNYSFTQDNCKYIIFICIYFHFLEVPIN